MVTNALEMRNGNEHYLHLKYLDIRQDEARSPIPQTPIPIPPKHHEYRQWKRDDDSCC
jgi:hypothetical protein